jgi:hypothetical protein
MMSACAELTRPTRVSRRPARYLLRREGDQWRLYFRTARAGTFTDAARALLTAEHLAEEAAALGRQAYLVIDFADGALEIRRLRRGPGHRGFTMRRRWLRAVNPPRPRAMA